MTSFKEKDGMLTLSVRVVPRASRTEVCGEMDGAIKVRIASPPIEGAANAELIKLFAKMLSVPKSSVEIISGQGSRSKSLRITGVTAEQFRRALG